MIDEECQYLVDDQKKIQYSARYLCLQFLSSSNKYPIRIRDRIGRGISTKLSLEIRQPRGKTASAEYSPDRMIPSLYQLDHFKETLFKAYRTGVDKYHGRLCYAYVKHLHWCLSSPRKLDEHIAWWSPFPGIVTFST